MRSRKLSLITSSWSIQSPTFMTGASWSHRGVCTVHCKHLRQGSLRWNAAPCLKRQHLSNCGGVSLILPIFFEAFPLTLSQNVEIWALLWHCYLIRLLWTNQNARPLLDFLHAKWEAAPWARVSKKSVLFCKHFHWPPCTIPLSSCIHRHLLWLRNTLVRCLACPSCLIVVVRQLLLSCSSKTALVSLAILICVLLFCLFVNLIFPLISSVIALALSWCPD